MKKLLLLTLLMCCVCTACGTKEEPVTNVTETPIQTEAVENVETPEVETEPVVEETETVVEAVVVKPLPSTIDINNITDCTVAISFNKEDIAVSEGGKTQLKVTVYDYDLYDMVDIANLKEGDTIMIQENEVVVETMETLESGLLFINGGMDNGGYDLWHNESGVYFEHGYNDVKSYKPVGDITLPLSDGFQFIDSSDLDKGDVAYTIEDMIKADIMYNFNPNNSSIIVEGGEVTQLIRTYTP